MMILNSRGCAEIKNNSFTPKKYSIIIDGVMYRVKSATKRGSLVLEAAAGFETQREVKRPGEALAEFARQASQPGRRSDNSPQQSLGEGLAWGQLDLNWHTLNLKVQRYMYFRKDGTPTTGQERMALAAELTKACGVTEQCAWNWSKDDASKPHRKNLIGIAQFFASR